ncbi:hypothetical protein NliqN6_6188 [Naganishia liquefaciens]|uniref:Uncharacterized protein n=1 Tax=Naganishia liquefaciens TaxID=104408 RepID=A0A8H3YJR2_9TREE|nr:hypothetical protein NliqN6_6188 [Naganishia liquefaciens]
MAKKKKAALKPVARGFATTSQPKKIVPEPESEAVTDPEDDASKTEIHNAVSGADGSGGVCNGKVAEGLDWEDDSKLEEGIYQGYVERLQEKGDREVAKILKAIDFDKRMIKGYIRLDIDPSLRDEILEADREQRPDKVARVSIPSDPVAKEKHLLRVYIIYQVLTKLGHAEPAVLECLKRMGEKDTWEDGLNWTFDGVVASCLRGDEWAPNHSMRLTSD